MDAVVELEALIDVHDGAALANQERLFERRDLQCVATPCPARRLTLQIESNVMSQTRPRPLVVRSIVLSWHRTSTLSLVSLRSSS